MVPHTLQHPMYTLMQVEHRCICCTMRPCTAALHNVDHGRRHVTRRGRTRTGDLLPVAFPRSAQDVVPCMTMTTCTRRLSEAGAWHCRGSNRIAHTFNGERIELTLQFCWLRCCILLIPDTVVETDCRKITCSVLYQHDLS